MEALLHKVKQETNNTNVYNIVLQICQVCFEMSTLY